MLIKVKRSWELPESAATPESVYLSRRQFAAGITRKGDPDGGAVLVKVATLDGRARLYAPARAGEGDRIWLDLSAGVLGDAEADVDAYARKRADTDPDLWVVEIEDKQGRHFLDEPVDR